MRRCRTFLDFGILGFLSLLFGGRVKVRGYSESEWRLSAAYNDDLG